MCGMLELYYLDTLLICGVIVTFLGGYLCFGTVPQKEIFRDYRRSRKIIGATIFIWGLQYLFLAKVNFRTTAPQLATAVNLSMYYAGALLFGMGIISLIKKDYINKRQTITDIIKYICVLCITWIGAIFYEGRVCNGFLITAAIIFGGDSVRMTIIFFKNYFKTVRNIDNYYSDNIANFIKWIYKCVSSICMMGILGAILAFAPKWIITIYAVGGLIVFTFIFNCLQNYLIQYEKIEPIMGDNVDSEKKQENESEFLKNNIHVFSEIKILMERWIEDKKFKTNGITIQQLALEFGTNRTYLSEFINSEYKQSFREWIGELRIEEAKRYLLESKGATMLEIAEAIGYTTSSHFIRSFTSKEGISPSKWRETATNSEEIIV